MQGIYLPDGSFKPTNYNDLSFELATRRNAGWLGGIGSWLNLLPDPDPVLRKRGDTASILYELSADDQITTAMLARKNRVLNCDHYGFRPGAPEGENPTPKAELLYNKLMADLERTNLRSIISGILDAPFYGLSPLEIIWESIDGWWHLKDIIPKPFHWFSFDVDNKPLFLGEKAEPMGLPKDKFVLVTHQATYDNPYGLRLLSRCLWPVAFKRGGLQFYAQFVEKYGQPWVVGKAPIQTNRDDKARMANDLARMIQDCVAVIPAGSEVDFLSASSSQADIHERFLSRQDRAISKLLMGQTLTVELEGRNNSQAAASTHEDVAEGLAEADRAMVADAFNEIAYLYAKVNDKATLAPIFSYEEPEDLHARAELDKKLNEMGVQFTAQHFEENYNLKPGHFNIATALTPNLASSENSSSNPSGSTSATIKKDELEFSAKAPLILAEQAQIALDTAIETLLPKALQKHDFFKQLENSLQDATSFEDMELIFIEALAPHLEPDALEDLLARAMTAAAGYGAAAVHEEGLE